MKTHTKNLPIAIFAMILFALFSCEGPAGSDGLAGADGTDGIDGVDAEVSCLECHGDGSIQAVTQEFVESVHSGGLVAVSYAGGRSYCADCHSHEGFLEFVATGDVVGNIVSPSPWECATCHQIHETFDATQDYTLRVTDPVSFIFDNTVSADFGAGNLCATCHQSRRAEPNTSNPGSTFTITSEHYGPHHGAQSNVLYGAGLAEIAGSMEYPTAGSSTHFTGASCTSCHMGTYDNGTGGHTFSPSVSSCTACHSGASDFNIGNTMTDVTAQLDQLKDLLETQGVIAETLVEIFELDPETGDIVSVLVSDGYHPVEGTFTMAQTQAFFNWIGLLEDRSFGVHNPAYVEALLTNSIEAID